MTMNRVGGESAGQRVFGWMGASSAANPAPDFDPSLQGGRV
ncbi:hypothetical protein B005_1874 [Nocardiopsis alba ATCC BAA-2165]|uniref:Uncharacterized protein n=1 Tax=Nocardiopsis alba (strain ATCC BAA-2165 / BE74) TaxID=1205910 RepID=J7KYA0_NOCAA|nr:hypothetical protein B005_1874 [Nocardiopsis alba ATCC BAA-2165]